MRWRGVSAEYTRSEREIMSALPIKEQAFVHLLKAVTEGTIEAPAEVAHQPERLLAKEKEVGAVPTFGFVDPEATGKSDTNPASDGNIPLYTDPEDIPFGKPARRKKIYAVAWSWRKHKIHKTKKRCEERLKVWKAWKERQGWTVIRMGSGYMGILGETREVIQLHEYDRETKERL